MPGPIIALLALLSLCLFYGRLPGVLKGTAPLLAISTVMVYFTLAGVLDLMVPAGWLFYGLCFGLGAFSLVRAGRNGRGGWPDALKETLLTPGTVLFAGAGALLLAVLAVRQPVFSQWDEFSFWGTAAKLAKLDGSLYPTADIGWWWTATERPGLIVLGWFAQFFSPAFAPWAVYWAYGMLFFACAAALLAPFGWRQWRILLPLGAVGLMLPFLFSVYYHTTHLSTAYLSAYGDLPAGILFGGALAAYFGAPRFGAEFGLRGEAAPLRCVLGRKRARSDRGMGGARPACTDTAKTAFWPALLPLAALALVKENVFAVALVAAGIMAADWLFFGGRAAGAGQPPGGKARAPARRGRWLWRLPGCAALLAAPVAAAGLWGRYAGAIAAQNAVTGAGGTNISAFTALAQAIHQLLNPAARSQRFTTVAGSMWQGLSGRVMANGQPLDEAFNVSMLGSALFTVGCILALFVLAAMLLRGQRGRVALAGGLSLLGFAGFNFVLLVFYAFLNKAESAYGTPDYARYLGAYLPGWLMLGLLLLASAGAQAQPEKQTARPIAAKAALLLACCALALRFGALVRPGYSLLDYPDRLYAPQRQAQRDIDALAAHISPGGRVFFVCQGGTGEEWFQASYHLLPTVLEYSLTGGSSLQPPGEGGAGHSLGDIEAYLRETSCDYILIDRLDDSFIEHYGALFTDGLAQFTRGPALYEKTGDGRYAPVEQTP